MCEQAVECEELLHMIHHGMRVLPEGMTVQEVPAFSVNNYPECEAGRAAIRESIADEVRKGILRELPYAAQRASALFTKEEPGKRRVIRDYSKPAGASINDSADAMRFGMMGVQDAQDAMQPFWYMAKTDIKSAYRTVHVHPTHRELLCFKYSPADGEREVYYEDTRSPFGLKNAPETFCRLTAAVRAMMVARLQACNSIRRRLPSNGRDEGGMQARTRCAARSPARAGLHNLPQKDRAAHTNHSVPGHAPVHE
jgi:hypothetical protein